MKAEQKKCQTSYFLSTKLSHIYHAHHWTHHTRFLGILRYLRKTASFLAHEKSNQKCTAAAAFVGSGSTLSSTFLSFNLSLFRIAAWVVMNKKNESTFASLIL